MMFAAQITASLPSENRVATRRMVASCAGNETTGAGRAQIGSACRWLADGAAGGSSSLEGRAPAFEPRAARRSQQHLSQKRRQHQVARWADDIRPLKKSSCLKITSSESICTLQTKADRSRPEPTEARCTVAAAAAGGRLPESLALGAAHEFGGESCASLPCQTRRRVERRGRHIEGNVDCPLKLRGIDRTAGACFPPRIRPTGRDSASGSVRWQAEQSDRFGVQN